MRPNGQIEFLFHRKFPTYTDVVDKAINRIVRETGDPELRDKETLQRIADELDVDFDKLSIQDEPGAEQAGTESEERDASGALTEWGCERLRSYLNAARDYKDALFDMDDKRFWELYSQDWMKERGQQQFKGKEKDQYEFFNLPHAAADFAYRRVAEQWSPEEAVALTFGKEPRIVNSETLKPYHPPSPFREEYARRLDLINRAVKSGRFSENMGPRKFLSWAREVGLNPPADLKPPNVESEDTSSSNQPLPTTEVSKTEQTGSRRSAETRVEKILCAFWLQLSRLGTAYNHLKAPLK